ncbi:MAG: DUF4864 domain-containing protein [Pseudomonadota bacterium]
MIKVLRAICIAILLFVAPAHAEEPADSIQSVIEDQLSAFQQNDAATAFQFASPSIQSKFGNAETFARMVQQGYPMVWRPRSHRMGELLQTEVGPVQVVVFEDTSGRLYEAGYLMQEVDGVWRINGVKLRALPALGA